MRVSEERWRHIDRIFHDALDRTPHERQRFLERECAQDPSLAQEVQALIDSYEEAGNFLEPARPSLVGQTFSSYQVKELIGAGSMGEVYRAHDLKLKRDVAIKSLPETFSRDSERIARFQREAEVLASLNHPNIAAIYGLEQVGDTRLLVLELIDGETLDRRLEKGVIPMDEALRIAAQLADALTAAHEKGIVHRDLKPSNIKISSNGVVKVLDFGIAKTSAGNSASPELMTPLKPGSVLGTAAYMSPEQASGLDADRTSDVWSFGCVVYEILVGRRAFEGDTVSSILAAVSTAEPDWRLLPASTPDAVRRLLRRCLKRERRLRLHDMADARIEIDEGQTDLLTPEHAVHSTSRRAWIIWISAVIVLLIAILFGTRRDIPNRASAPERRMDLAGLPTTAPTSFAISPDGQKIVFEATVEGRSSLWLLSLDSGNTRPLSGTESGRTYSPFWAPDSKSVGFFAYSQDSTLRRIDIRTGAVQTLASIGAIASGGTWNRDGIILYGVAGNIFRIAETGGKPETVLAKDAPATYTAPHFISGGRKFLYNARHIGETSSAYLADLDGMPPRRIVDADAGVEYSGSRKLFFVNQGTLFAQDFDPDRAELSGQRTPVAEHVTVLGPKAAMSISSSGPIVYRIGTTDSDAQLAWFDRSGKEIQVVGEPFKPAYGLALSPDERFVAYVRQEGRAGNIWLHDLNRNIATPFASDGAEPAWSPDGGRVVYCKSGPIEGIFQKAVAESSEELLARSGLSPNWSANGYVLFDRSTTPNQPKDLWALRVTSIGKIAGDAFPQVQTSADERSGVFSPDGKWIAFSSNKSGRREIYVRPFAGKAPEVQISTNGGVQVRWRGDGKELFYLNPTGRLMAVGIKTTASVIIPGSPTPLFSIHAFGAFESLNTAYDASADGQRFLVLTSTDAMAPAPIKLILDWKAP